MRAPWSIGAPKEEKSLWLKTEAWAADTDVPLPAFAPSGAAPYENRLQTLTLCIDASHADVATRVLKPELLVDGVVVADGLAAAGTTRPDDAGTRVSIQAHKAADTKDLRPSLDDDEERVAFAPIACTMLIGGHAPVPYSAKVKLRSGSKVYHSADLSATRATDAMAEVALMPFPLTYQLISGEAKYEIETSSGDTRTEVRDLKYYSEAVKRVRTAFLKLVELGTRDGGNRISDPENIIAPALEKSILAYLRGDVTDVDGSPLGILFDSDPEPITTYLQVSVVMREGDDPIVWRLLPDPTTTLASDYWKYFENQRSYVLGEGGIIEQIDQAFDKLNALGLTGLLIDTTAAKARLKTLTDTIASYVLLKKPDRVAPALPGRDNYPLRVWGPIMKASTPKVAKLTASESQIDTETRRSVVATTRRLRDYFDRLGPVNVVTRHTQLPAGASVVGTLVADTPIVPSVALTNAPLDSMRLAPLYPAAVACSMGEFTHPGSVTEAVALLGTNDRASAGDGVDLFKKLGLDHSPEATAALAAFSDIVVHLCAGAEDTFDGGLGLSVESCVLRAMIYTRNAAAFVNDVCARPELHFANERDARFFTMKGGAAARMVLRHLSCWTALRGTSETDPQWSFACRKSAAKFASFMTRIATGNLKVHPTTFPFMATQTLWTWPSIVKPATAVSVQSSALEDMRRRAGIEEAPKLGTRSDHAQFVTAKQAMKRLDVIIKAMGVAQNTRATHAARRSIVLSRPSITVGEWAGREFFVHISDLNDGMDKQKEMVDSSIMDSALTRASWARRAIGEYKTWRRSEPDVKKARDSDGVAGAIAALSKLALNVDAEGTVAYYVPFGIMIGRSPLSAPHLAFAESRVWIDATRILLNTPVVSLQAPAVGYAVTIDIRECLPHDTSIRVSEAAVAASGALPLVDPLVITRTGSTIIVPVCVNAYDLAGLDELASEGRAIGAGLTATDEERLGKVIDDVRTIGQERIDKDYGEVAVDRPDRYRCLVFSTERIWQALTLAVAMEAKGVDIVLPERLSLVHMRRLVAATTMASGILQRMSGAASLKIRFATDKVSRLQALIGAVSRVREGMQKASTAGLAVAPVSEMAASMALWSQ